MVSFDCFFFVCLSFTIDYLCSSDVLEVTEDDLNTTFVTLNILFNVLYSYLYVIVWKNVHV